MNTDNMQAKSQTDIRLGKHAEYGDFKVKLTVAVFLGGLCVLDGLLLIFIGVYRRLSAVTYFGFCGR